MSQDLTDVALAEKLRREDPEQFHTLVRMHLSFVLDLQTDDDYPAEKTKSFPIKWVLTPFSKKTKCPIKGVMEGAPLTQEGICQVYQLIEFLSIEENIIQEGIFRRTGLISRQQELKSLLNQGVTLDIPNSQFSVHDCACVLKHFLMELPEPLLTDAHYSAYCQIAELCGTNVKKIKVLSSNGEENQQTSNTNSVCEGQKSRLLRSLQLLLLILPTENRSLLRDVFDLLHLAANHSCVNKMSAENLATLFTPLLLCPRKLPPESLIMHSKTMTGVIAFMISQGPNLFEIPPKLATDIRAYWNEKERRKISPTSEANTSINSTTSCISNGAAKTVFTFVDREKTAQAHQVNPTEAALAQLYAHIQSLPESSKKRKLIKQFNKENGHGTPSVQRYAHGNTRTKSLGDSIKKHIFNKTIKAPKNNNFEEGRSAINEIRNDAVEKPKVVKSLKKRFDDESPPSGGGEPLLSDESPAARSSPCREDGHQVILKNLAEQIAAHSDDESDPISPAKAVPPSLLPPPPPPPLSGQPPQEGFFSPPPRAWASSTPGPLRASGRLPPVESRNSLNHSSLFLTPENTSMSPITRSTQKMSKAMQETMMTPRSRKPVVVLSGSNLCHLANFDGWNAHAERDYDDLQERNPPPSLNTQRTVSSECTHETPKIDNNCQIEEEECGSLTSAFESYLATRSVLTASPVDLSFSSQTGDYESSGVDELNGLSQSLLFCLNGNQPPESENSSIEFTRKRSATNEMDCSDSEELLDKSKKCLLEIESSMLSTTNKVHETSF